MCGGRWEDNDLFAVFICKAKGGEAFFPLGVETDAPALLEKAIHYDEEGVHVAQIGEKRSDHVDRRHQEAILVIEAINGEQAARAKSAMTELQTLLIEDYLEFEEDILLIWQLSIQVWEI